MVRKTIVKIFVMILKTIVDINVMIVKVIVNTFVMIMKNIVNNIVMILKILSQCKRIKKYIVLILKTIVNTIVMILKPIMNSFVMILKTIVNTILQINLMIKINSMISKTIVNTIGVNSRSQCDPTHDTNQPVSGKNGSGKRPLKKWPGKGRGKNALWKNSGRIKRPLPFTPNCFFLFQRPSWTCSEIKEVQGLCHLFSAASGMADTRCFKKYQQVVWSNNSDQIALKIKSNKCQKNLTKN